MKKQYLIPLTLVSITAIGTLLFMRQTTFNNAEVHYRIAILEPASHPAMDEISQGFIDTIKKNSNHNQQYKFTRYNANGNPTLLRSQAEEIVHQNYDLIMSIGTNASRTLHELTTKKQRFIPLVFTAIGDPVKCGLVASLQSSGNHTTGVQDTPNYPQQMEALLTMMPNIKNILLVYDPVGRGGDNDADAKAIASFLATKNITLNYAKVFHANEIQAKVQPLLPGNDVVMILTDHTVVSGVDSLITLCNRYHIPLFASDLPSGDKGAAIAYGVTEYEHGLKAAQQALLILEQHRKPQDLPVTTVKDMKIKINSKTAEQQGLHLSAEQKETIRRNGGIII